MEIIYSSFAEGFIWNGWRYFCLGVDSYEQLYYWVMAHLIDKAAVVAEIEKLKGENKPNSKSISEYVKGGVYGFDMALEKVLSNLDTLEVKEADLKKEIDSWYYHLNIPENCNIPQTTIVIDIIEKTAKHFFELGLSSQLSWQDVKRLAEIGETFMNSEESDNLSEEEYYTEILNKFKAQKWE